MFTKHLLRQWTAALCLAAHLTTSTLAQAPAWWLNQRVVSPGKALDDLAAANLGQLKSLAAKAADQMNAVLSGGAGTEINEMINQWKAHPENAQDYAAANIGQAKSVASKFYTRLGTPPPWTSSTTDDQDYATINLGQLKMLFSFVIPQNAGPTVDALSDRGQRTNFVVANQPIDMLPNILSTTGEMGGTTDMGGGEYGTTADVILMGNSWYRDLSLATSDNFLDLNLPFAEVYAYWSLADADDGLVSYYENVYNASITTRAPWPSLDDLAEWTGSYSMDPVIAANPGDQIASVSSRWQNKDGLDEDGFNYLSIEGRQEKIELSLHTEKLLPGTYTVSFRVRSYNAYLNEVDLEPDISTFTLTLPMGEHDSNSRIIEAEVPPAGTDGTERGVTIERYVDLISQTFTPGGGGGGGGQLKHQDITGPAMRKIALNGVPMPDEKPQKAEETDQPKEETYIDAFTLALSHATSDIYVPMAASEMPLTVRRQVSDMSWIPDSEMALQHRINQPFGQGWSSSLCSYVEYKETNGDTTVTVVDENGVSQQFLVTGIDEYQAMPYSSTDAKSYMNTLTSHTSGTPPTQTKYLVYKKKFGTTLTFESTAVWSQFTTTGGSRSASYTMTPPNSVPGRVFQQGSALPEGLTWSAVNNANTTPVSNVMVGTNGVRVLNLGTTKGIATEPANFGTLSSGLGWRDRTTTSATAQNPFNARGTTSNGTLQSSDKFTNGVAAGSSLRSPGFGTTQTTGNVLSRPSNTDGVSYTVPQAGFFQGYHIGVSDTGGAFLGVTDGVLSARATGETMIGISTGLAGLGIADISDRMSGLGISQNDAAGWSGGYGEALSGSITRFAESGNLLAGGTGPSLSTDQVTAMRGTGAFLGGKVMVMGENKPMGSAPGNAFLGAGGGNAVREGAQVTPLPRIAGGPGARIFAENGNTTLDVVYRPGTGDSPLAKVKEGVGVKIVEDDGTSTGGGPSIVINRYFHRLKTVTDRWGNKLEYDYPAPDSLIPSTIKDAKRDSEITITSGAIDNGGIRCVTNVTTPEGRSASYDYRTLDIAGEKATLLERVTYSDGSFVHYGYDHDAERDPTGSQVHHVNVAAIMKPDSGCWTFEYAFQSTNSHESSTAPEDGGEPRWVRKIVTPDSKTVTLTNHRYLKVLGGNQAFGKMTNIVQDVDGTLRTYVFGDVKVAALPLGSLSALSQEASKIQDYIMYTSLDIHVGPDAMERYEFDTQAGLALKKSVALDGSITSYEYTDEGPEYDEEEHKNGFKVAAPLDLFRYYNDPTAKIDPGLIRTEYAYDAETRVMNSVIGPGINVRYTIQPETGLRLDERHYSSDTLLTQTNFAYTHAQFRAFMTDKVVERQFSDPEWATIFGTSYTHDNKGRVTSERVSIIGAETFYTYDADGNKLTTTDPLGRVTAFTYDGRGRLKSVIYAQGTADEARKDYVYDNSGNKVVEVDENNGTTFRSYDAYGRVTTTTFDLNGNGVPEDRTHDIVTSTAYNAYGQPTSVINPNGVETTYLYDGLGRLAVTKVAPGNELAEVTEYYYEPGSRFGGSVFDTSTFKPNRVVDPRGYQTITEYDGLLRPWKIWKQFAAGSEEGEPGAWALTQYAYDGAGNLHTVTDPLGKVTTTDYDGMNRPIKVTNADSTFSTASYTSTGLKWQTVDEQAWPTEMEYDAAGRLVLVREPVVRLPDGTFTNPVIETSYDLAGNVITVTDALGRVTTTAYDDRNRPITTTFPAVFDATTGLTTSPVVHKYYDRAGKVVRVTDPLGYNTDTRYDLAGRPIQVESPVVLVYDATQVPTAKSTVVTTEYDMAGNVVRITDADNRITLNHYDDFNRLTQTTDAGGIATAFGYDQGGNRTSVADALGHTTEFVYDGLNRLLQEKPPAPAAPTLHYYNEVNKTGTRTPDNVLTEFTYDNRHRLTQASGNGVVRICSYDHTNNLLMARQSTWSGRITSTVYDYDSHGRVIAEKQGNHLGNSPFTITYLYDLAGNRIKVGGTGGELRCTYDDLNRLTRQDEVTLSAIPGQPETVLRSTLWYYDLANRTLVQSLANGTRVENYHDGQGRLSNRVLFGPVVGVGIPRSTLSLQNYLYDGSGNLRQMVESSVAAPGKRTVTLAYDQSLRLNTEQIHEADGTTTLSDYDYDAAGNRTQLSKTTGNATPLVSAYSYNNLNQLTGFTKTGATAVSYTYDANGNRATRTQGAQTDTYTWNRENRLIQVDHAATAKTYHYDYDHRARRVIRQEGTPATLILFAGGTSVAELESAGSLTGGFNLALKKRYVRGTDMGGGVGGLLYSNKQTSGTPEAWTCSNAGELGGLTGTPVSGTSNTFSPSLNHYNGRGDVVVKTDATGTVSWTGSYEAFGTRTRETGTNEDRQRANTKDEDPTGLLNEGFRYRDLETGTWLSRDPAGFVDGPNLYAYVRCNPWTMFDPEGLSPAWADPRSLPNTPPSMRAALDQKDRETAQSVNAALDAAGRFAQAFQSRDFTVSGIGNYDSNPHTAERLGETARDFLDAGLMMGKAKSVGTPGVRMVPATAGGTASAAGPATSPVAVPFPILIPKTDKSEKPGGKSAKDNSEESETPQTTVLGNGQENRVVPFAKKTGARTLDNGLTSEEADALPFKELNKLNDGQLRKHIKAGDKFRDLGDDGNERKRDLRIPELNRLKERNVPVEQVPKEEVQRVLGQP